MQSGDRHWQKKHHSLDNGAEDGALLVVGSEGKQGVRVWLQGAVEQAEVARTMQQV